MFKKKKKYDKCCCCGDKHTKTYPVTISTRNGEFVDVHLCDMCATLRKIDVRRNRSLAMSGNHVKRSA